MKKIKHKIFSVLPISLKVLICYLKFQRGSLNLKIYNGELYKSLLEQALKTYLSDEERSNKQIRGRLIRDVLYSYFRFKVKPHEYFNFDFRNKPDSIRKEYISDEERVGYLLQNEGRQRKMELRDKYAFYLKVRPFFKRAVFHLNKLSSREEFAAFSVRCKSIFCKPNTGAMGVGICMFVVDDESQSFVIYEKLLAQTDDWIIEEKIQQGLELSEWNDSSINTVRFPSFLCKGKFTVFYPKIRIGRKGQIVDNFAQGGMIAMIDAETGKICSDAYTKGNQIYKVHPDSGKPFKGMQMPQWPDLLEYAEKLHRSMPQQPYVAWDFAYTTKGWDVVEANWGQLGSTQMMLGRGVKKEFVKFIEGA